MLCLVHDTPSTPALQHPCHNFPVAFQQKLLLIQQSQPASHLLCYTNLNDCTMLLNAASSVVKFCRKRKAVLSGCNLTAYAMQLKYYASSPLDVCTLHLLRGQHGQPVLLNITF